VIVQEEGDSCFLAAVLAEHAGDYAERPAPQTDVALDAVDASSEKKLAWKYFTEVVVSGATCP
jgi:hypothetical protein